MPAERAQPASTASGGWGAGPRATARAARWRAAARTGPSNHTRSRPGSACPARRPGPGAGESGRSRARAAARGRPPAASRPPPGARGSRPAARRASRAGRGRPGRSGRSSSASRTTSPRRVWVAGGGWRVAGCRRTSPRRERPRNWVRGRRPSSDRWPGLLPVGEEDRRGPSIPCGPAGLRTGPIAGGRPWMSWPRSAPPRSAGPACARYPGRRLPDARDRGDAGPPARAWIPRAGPTSPA